MSDLKDMFINTCEHIANTNYGVDFADLPTNIQDRVSEQATGKIERQIPRPKETYDHYRDSLFDYFKTKREIDEVLRHEQTAS